MYHLITFIRIKIMFLRLYLFLRISFPTVYVEIAHDKRTPLVGCKMSVGAA